MSACVSQLGFVVLETKAVDDWRGLAETVGFEIIPLADDRLGFRLDEDRSARIELQEASSDRVSALGWEAPDLASFDQIMDRLETAGASPRLDVSLASQRRMLKLATFVDPNGLPGQLFWGPPTHLRTRLKSPHGVCFRAGSEGFGHVTLAVPNLLQTIDFYVTTLGMKLTETADVGNITVAFLRSNTRHHDLALVELPDSGMRVLHVMVEVSTLDELGSLRDRLLDSRFNLDRDIGRHPTDGVISMYIKTPSSFELEVGWGSVVVSEDSWPVDRYDRRGWSWGHKSLAHPQSALGAA